MAQGNCSLVWLLASLESRQAAESVTVALTTSMAASPFGRRVAPVLVVVVVVIAAVVAITITVKDKFNGNDGDNYHKVEESFRPKL